MIMATWSQKYVNSLADAAFAYVKSGKKDDEGKTVPRANRYLPHHNDTVKSATEKSSVDLPHLRNALARASQTKLSPAEKTKAINHLRIHAKQFGVGDEGKKLIDDGYDDIHKLANMSDSEYEIWLK